MTDPPPTEAAQTGSSPLTSASRHTGEEAAPTGTGTPAVSPRAGPSISIEAVAWAALLAAAGAPRLAGPARARSPGRRGRRAAGEPGAAALQPGRGGPGPGRRPRLRRHRP